jgi:hypothetical protein
MSFCMVPGGCDRLHRRQRRQTCRETPAAQSGKSRVHSPGDTTSYPSVRAASASAVFSCFPRNKTSIQPKIGYFQRMHSAKNYENGQKSAIFDCIGNAM